MAIRYRRDTERIAEAFKSVRRGVRDVQRPTGTEKARTAEVAQEALSIGTGAKSVADQAAEDVLTVALEAAVTAKTVDGMRRVIASVSEPAAPAAGWMNGDQWWQYEVEPVTGRNRLDNIWIWNGSSWAAFQLVADSVLVPSSVGSVLLADGAVDAMTIRGAQVYGGYIEAPVIASSDKLGSGVNVLNDPAFASTADTAWVASGHLGDPVATFIDTVSWSQSYPVTTLYGGTEDHWHEGSATIVATLTPAARNTGSLMFANYSWKPANRTLNNPYTFPTTTQPWLSEKPGAARDPSWAAVKVPTPLPGTARTTYLTNTAVAAVVSGERWNVRFGFSKISAASQAFVTLTLEIINSSSAAVLWSHIVSADEMTTGSVNTWWDSAFTGNVKLRIKTVYTAAGGATTRKVQTGGFARKYVVGALTREFVATSSNGAIGFGSYPSETYASTISGFDSSYSSLDVVASSAMLAKVEPEKGWRLTEDGGLELFNSLGAKTAQFDGQDNFLSGELATAESGQRWELVGDQINLYSATDTLLGSIRRDGTKIRVNGVLSLNGFIVPTEAAYVSASFTATSGHTVNAKSWARKRSDGYVYGAIYIDRTADFVNGAVVCNLPTALKPIAAEEDSVAIVSKGGGAGFHVGQALSSGGLRIWSGPVAWPGNRQAYIPLSYFAAV